MFNSAKKEISQEELSNSSSIIGKGTSLEGDLNTAGNLRVEGKVSGSIQTKAKLVLGETAVMQGNIIAQTAEISGEVHGAIKVSGLLTLRPTAVIDGDITTGKLVVEVGAKFNGKCNMGNSFKETKAMQPTPVSHQKHGTSIDPHPQQVILSEKREQNP
jgi:cytoskeletal protein CcmA (bactofilin family)